MTTLLCLALLTKPTWHLTWRDEFDGASGRAPDASRWTHEVGGDGWGNDELETYTDGSANSFLDGEGHLVIEARKEEGTGGKPRYTSARLVTRHKFSQKYGRFEARIKLPKGQGIWPAFWMMGDVRGSGWPECGEIDILESIGPVAKTAYGTAHGPGYSGAQGVSHRYESPESIADGFHVYAVEWEPGQIRWFFDDHCYGTMTPADLHGHRWVFDQPFFMILNLAVGGGWPGKPDATTQFPQRMVVDYVRVYN